MKQVVFSILMSLSLMTLCAQSSSQQVASEIKALVYKYATENDIPTINVGIVLDGQIRFINYGVDKRTTQNKTNEHSIFQIASVGKILTGIVVNDLIQKGKLDINEPILSYLPDSYSKKIKSKLEGITIRDLLNHRSGLPRQSKIIKRKNDEPIVYNYNASDFEKDFDKMKLEKEDVFNYSNFGYAVLGYIAERVSGASFEELLSDLTKQYKMESTSVSCKDGNLLVTPYKEDNRKVETQNWEMGKLAPPSGLYSSVSDLTRLLLAQLKVYKEGNKKDILFLTNDIRDAWGGTGISYGYGLFDWGNGEFGHGGGMDGYGSEYWFYPKENVGFALLTSSGGKWVTELSKEISKILIDMSEE
ncbi:MAG: beta-lactamase family protein [Chitinophagales bacterium]|nr:beta-lactamase family protein [Chitinophagales bacterium]